MAVHKVKVVAILDTRFPVMRSPLRLLKNQIRPNIDHSVVYGTSGLASTKFISAYSSLTLKFGKFRSEGAGCGA